MAVQVDEQRTYNPHGGAQLLCRCRKQEILFDGPAGTGKTRAVLEKVVLACLKYPHARALITRKTRASMTETVLVTLEERVLPAWGCFGRVNRNQRANYRFPNGSVIVVAGWDKPTKILSGEYDLFVYHQAEEGSREEWENACSRLRWGAMPYSQAIAECNPGPPEHWLLKRAETKKMQRILSRHTDNPSLTPEYLQILQTSLTGHRLQRLFYGKWVAAEGLVYELYDESKHRHKRRTDWRRFVIGVDDGYSNPLAAHLYGVDGDGRFHALREFYRTKTLPEDVIAWAKRLQRAVRIGYGQSIEAVVIDPSAAKLLAAFADAGFVVHPADNKVSDGIKTVNEYLQVNGDDRPRFSLDPVCINMHKEFGRYEWAKTAAGQQKDVPKKENDHAMDELRYVAMYLSATSGDMEVISL